MSENKQARKYIHEQKPVPLSAPLPLAALPPGKGVPGEREKNLPGQGGVSRVAKGAAGAVVRRAYRRGNAGPENSTSLSTRAIVALAMSNAEYEIRAGRADDAGELCELMRALQAHLKEPTANISAEKLLRDVLCEGSAHSVLVCEEGGRLAGYALFHETYESSNAQRGVYMADLFVAEDARGRGLGRALVAAVAGAARARDLKFVWWVSEAWDEQAQGFYATLGANHDPAIAHSVSFESFESLAEEGEKKPSRS